MRAWPDVRAWLQTNEPTARGMCLNTSMRSYGASGMGASDATEAVGLTRDLQTAYTTDIPAGAHVLYTGGSQGHGHSVVSDGGGWLWTVDWYSGLNITRVAQRDMESAWNNLEWAGWSRYYGEQALDVVDDEQPEPEPPPEDDPMPDFVNAGGADLTVDDEPASIVWADSWGTDYRTSDRKGLDGFQLGTIAVHVTLDPADTASLCLREATYDDGEWWHGAWYETAPTSGGTGTGVTFAARPGGGAWKVQAKANGAGTVKLTDISLRGLVWP